jgi:hypothetical protein
MPSLPALLAALQGAAAEPGGQPVVHLEVTLFACRDNATLASPECELQLLGAILSQVSGGVAQAQAQLQGECTSGKAGCSCSPADVVLGDALVVHALECTRVVKWHTDTQHHMRTSLQPGPPAHSQAHQGGCTQQVGEPCFGG